MQTFTLPRPDDAHLHLRDGPYLQRTVTDSAERFARAIIMPNLKPPITTLPQLQAYQQRILQAVPAHTSFQPLMTLYMHAHLSEETIQTAKQMGVIGVKLYPAGVTTNSEAGVQSLVSIYPVLTAMQKYDLPLLIHGEVNDPEVDIFDRERFFLDELAQLIKDFPNLRIVLEHITTADAVQFVSQANDLLAATITPHHLLLNRNHLLSGGIHPHYYCLPIVKRRRHQESLIQAATSGNPKFFLGTDSAPHTLNNKESACGCAGIYSGHAAIELYTQVFEEQGALSRLPVFASQAMADFYQLPRTLETITLVKNTWQVPERLTFGTEEVVPFFAGLALLWQLRHSEHPI